MIRTALEFRIRPGCADALVQLFRDERILEKSTEEGALSAEIAITDDGSSALVTAVWDDPVAYAAWTSRADRADLAERLEPLLSQEIDEATVGRVYTIAHTAKDGERDE